MPEPKVIQASFNSSRRHDTPFCVVEIGGDKFLTGGGFLRSAVVSLGESKKASSCSFDLYDPGMRIAEKYFSASYLEGGLVGLPDEDAVATPNSGSSSVKGDSSFPPEIRALLDLIAFAEGTSDKGNANGYNIRLGGGTFDHTKPHPLIADRQLDSDAAGRYQFLSTTWAGANGGKNVPMTPAKQDQAAVYLIRGRGAYESALKGEAELEATLTALRNEWSSLPGASQTRMSMSEAKAKYSEFLKRYKGTTELVKVDSTKPVNTSNQPKEVAPPAPAAVEAKGQQIFVWLGFSKESLIAFGPFQHIKTAARGFSAQTVVFEGQSIRWELTRRTKNAAYTNMTLKQVAQKIASAHGLQLSMPVNGPKYSYLSQDGLSDYALLQRECDLIGFRIYDDLKMLHIAPRDNKELGFVLRYGDNIRGFEVMDQADNQDKASNEQTTGEAKFEIDSLTGQMKQNKPENYTATGIASSTTKTEVATGKAQAPVAGKAAPDSPTLPYTVQRQKEERVKGFKATATFQTTEAALLLTPDSRVITEGLPGWLSRAWIVDQVQHNYGSSGLVTTLTLYTPMVPKTPLGDDANKETGKKEEPGTVPGLEGWTHPLPGGLYSRGTGSHGYPAVDLSSGKPGGASVKAANSGVVTAINDGCSGVQGLDTSCGGGYGNYVFLKHGNGMETRYCHLVSGSIYVKIGQQVRSGQVLGKEGNSGNSYGAHLHFEILNGGKIDPDSFMSSKGVNLKQYGNV